MFVIAVSGNRPQAGKGTFATKLEEALKDRNSGIVVRDKFAAPLGYIAQLMLGMDAEQFAVWREERKDHPLPGYGFTMRDLLIKISEEWMKPMFGRDIFGRLALGRVRLAHAAKDADIVIFDDCGFPEEVQVLMTAPGIKLLVVRVERNHGEPIADSRSILSAHFIVHNDWSIEDLAKTADWMAGEILMGVHDAGGLSSPVLGPDGRKLQ